MDLKTMKRLAMCLQMNMNPTSRKVNTMTDLGTVTETEAARMTGKVLLLDWHWGLLECVSSANSLRCLGCLWFLSQ